MCGQRQLAPRWWRNHMAKADRSSQKDDEASKSNSKERAHRLHALLKRPELRDIQIDKGTRVVRKKPPYGMDERQVTTERATCGKKKEASPPRGWRIHTDNSEIFLTARPNLYGTHDSHTSHLSETNGVVEKSVCRLREGTAAMLVQYGLPRNGSDCAMECRCYL